MGRIEDLVMRNNEAFSRGDAEGALRGWSDDGLLTPVPGGRSYRGREEILLFFTKEIYDIPEFSFRIYAVLEQRDFALVFGRYSVPEEGQVIDKGIFWILEVRDDEVISFEALGNVGEAFAAFKQRLDGG
jgi:ketosteroid isomerase-like protein